MAPTAVYYHFGGKAELFAQTLRAALNGFSAHIFRVRPDDGAASVESLRSVIRAGWGYWDAHPDAARLVARYSEGSTADALRLRREWEQRHLQRAYDYAPDQRPAGSTRQAREQHAINTLAVGVLLDVILISQAAALDGTLGSGLARRAHRRGGAAVRGAHRVAALTPPPSAPEPSQLDLAHIP